MTSSSKFIYTPNTTQIPNIIIDYWMHQLTDTQFKVLLVITRKTLGWHKTKDKISKSQIEDLTGFKRNAVRNAIRDLEELKLIKSFSNKTKEGDFDSNSYQINMLEVNQEGGGGLARKPRGGLAPEPRVGSLASPTKPKTKPTPKKGIVLDADKSLPFADGKKEKNSLRKFPLKKNQQPTLDLLKSLKLECSEDVLFILIRTYSEKQIQDCVTHLQHEIEKGTEFKKGKIAFLRSLLSGKMSLINSNVLENKKYAEEAKKRSRWNSLKIAEKYVMCEKTNKEIPLNRDPEDFKEMLKDLFDLSKNY